MTYDKAIFGKSYFVGVIMLLLLTAILLGWMTYVRHTDFHNYQLEIGKEAAKGVELEISHFITEKQRLVRVFADDHLEQIRELALNPDNDLIKDKLGSLISQYFPNRFAFSIANSNGDPLFENFDGLISELCLNDIKEFSSSHEYHPYIHPNTEGYHFDVMVPYGKNDDEGILFISFLADMLGTVINNIQPPGHTLLLVNPQSSDLIEVFDKGARNHWVRNDYRLSEQEKSRIMVNVPVPDTRWNIIDLHNRDIHNDYLNKLIYESIFIFSIFTFISISLVFKLYSEEKQRKIAEQQKADLMSVVSHEFRSPVAVIKGAMDLIQDGDAGEIAPDVKKFIDMASTSTSQLMHLVNDFLDIQKLDAGKLQFHMETEGLRAIVQQSVEANLVYAREFNVEYKLVEPQDKANVCCDSKRIYQVITNLLSNAAKYGGKQDTIEISVNNMGSKARVSIKDNGPGIPEDFHDKVFSQFSMANISNKTSIKSSGLGLNIAKSIVEHHNGNIGFDTSTGKGTTFWFELPVIKQ